MASNARAIMRALKATQGGPGAAPSSGGFGNYGGGGPQLGNAMSPLVASYSEWQGGRFYGQNNSLPRDWATFLSGAYGPLEPIKPVPIDMPRDGEERPEPRRMEYPVGWDMPMGMPGSEGWGKLATFHSLREMADSYSVARACLQLRRNELRGLGWDIGPTRAAAKAMRGDHKAARDFAERRAQVVRFFRKPDPDYHDFTSWFTALIEDVLVIDAPALYLHPPRVKGKGVLGTNLTALEILDGAGIKPLVNIRGGKPAPPNPAYQQFEFGVPRVDLMTMIQGQDIPEAEQDKMLAEYRGDQLLYLPMNIRSWTVYGMSPLEQAIIPVMSGLAKQQYGLNFFSEGTLPGAYISVGDPGQSPSQMAEWQTTLNAIAGDQAWKHKVIALPGGSKVEPQKMITLADAFDSMVQIETAMAFDVQPYEIGAIPNLAAAAAAGGPSGSMAKTQVQASRKPTERVANVALLLFLKATVFDRVIQGVFGQHDMEMTFEGLEEAENAAEITDMAIEQIGSGLLSIDEGRQMIGRDPWGLPITSDPVWATQWGGAVPLTGIAQATAQPQGGSPSPQQGGQKPSAAVDLTGPGGVSRPGAPSAQIPGTHTGLPRNQQSRGQRRTQAAGVSGSQAGAQRSAGTPAHSGARAERARRPAAASKGELAAKVRNLLEADEPPVDSEKAARELSLLKSHLNRGGTVTEWERRFLPERALATVSEHLAKGMDAGQACDMAKATLETVPA